MELWGICYLSWRDIEDNSRIGHLHMVTHTAYNGGAWFAEPWWLADLLYVFCRVRNAAFQHWAALACAPEGALVPWPRWLSWGWSAPTISVTRIQKGR